MVADAAIAGVEAVANGLAAALDKVLQVFQTGLKAAVQIAGAVITGDFAEALRIAVQAACDIAGIDSKPIFDFIDRAASQVTAILKDPKTFFNNLMTAIGGGVRNFSKNIKQHLIKGLIGWLTGALSEANLSLPATFDAPGILSLVMQILGLTYENIKAKVIKKFPPSAKVFGAIESGIEIVQRLLREGPMALWEEVKQKFSNLKEIVMSGIRDFVIATVVKEGIAWLLSLLNPAAAIVKLLKLVFDLVMFLVERFQQIKDFVMSVYNSIVAIASGNLSQAKQAVEDALSRSLPVVISLLASLAGLGGIGKTVKNIIGKVTKPINKIIDSLITRMVNFAKKLLKKGKAAAKKVKEKVLSLIQWWTKKKNFKDTTGHSHQLYYKGKSENAQLYVASYDPVMLKNLFTQKMKEATSQDQSNFTTNDVMNAKNYYETNLIPLESKLKQVDKIYKNGPGAKQLSAEKKAKGINENKKLVQDLERVQAEFTSKYLSKLFGSTSDDYPPPKLPVMADNKKASSFTADYIVKGKKFKVQPGTESGQHVGNLDGWSQLQAAKLTDQSQWVRMHLLPHKLGGNAVDSNLTPARGPKTNIPFSHAVEQPAIKAAVEGPEDKNKPIWYRFRIDYYSAQASPFPKYLKAEWGHYESKNGKFTRGPTVKSFEQTPAKPEFTPVTPNLNNKEVTAGEIAAVSGVDRGFVELLFNVRGENSGSLGKSAADVKLRMEKKYVEVDASGNKRYRFGVKNFDPRLNLVLAAINSGKITLD
jgi:hypothetical protein